MANIIDDDVQATQWPASLLTRILIFFRHTDCLFQKRWISIDYNLSLITEQIWRDLDQMRIIIPIRRFKTLKLNKKGWRF